MIGLIALTYILASIFAIAGMGAAGVLIPNYIMFGLGVRVAMFLGLSQNTAELTVATAMNSRKNLIEWRKVTMVLIPALFFVPIGAYINIRIPRILVLVSFALFLLFALYRMLFPKRIAGEKANIIVISLGSLEGFIAGLIGMDAAPIALIAFAYLLGEPKKVSANTAAAALGISAAALLTYYIMLPSMPIDTTILIGVIVAGLFGGITGAFLMHHINPKQVRYTMLAILLLAFAEITLKIISSGGNVPQILYISSVGIVIASLLVFLSSFIYGLLKKSRKHRVSEEAIE